MVSVGFCSSGQPSTQRARRQVHGGTELSIRQYTKVQWADLLEAKDGSNPHGALHGHEGSMPGDTDLGIRGGQY